MHLKCHRQNGEHFVPTPMSLMSMTFYIHIIIAKLPNCIHTRANRYLNQQEYNQQNDRHEQSRYSTESETRFCDKISWQLQWSGKHGIHVDVALEVINGYTDPIVHRSDWGPRKEVCDEISLYLTISPSPTPFPTQSLSSLSLSFSVSFSVFLFLSFFFSFFLYLFLSFFLYLFIYSFIYFLFTYFLSISFFLFSLSVYLSLYLYLSISISISLFHVFHMPRDPDFPHYLLVQYWND